jgi:ABC-type multidrug transport system fused ATPase/permease subunit
MAKKASSSGARPYDGVRPSLWATLRSFAHYYKPYKGIFVADLIATVILVAVTLSYPQLLRHFSNTLFADGS